VKWKNLQKVRESVNENQKRSDLLRGAKLGDCWPQSAKEWRGWNELWGGEDSAKGEWEGGVRK